MTAKREPRAEAVAMEYAAEASYAPLVSLRKGRYKLNLCDLDPDQLAEMTERLTQVSCSTPAVFTSAGSRTDDRVI